MATLDDFRKALSGLTGTSLSDKLAYQTIISSSSGGISPVAPEPVQLLPKDLLEFAEQGDRSNEWLEIAESDTIGAATEQLARTGMLMNQSFGSSFASHQMLQQLQNQQASAGLGMPANQQNGTTT